MTQSAEEALTELQESILFSPEFPKWTGYVHKDRTEQASRPTPSWTESQAAAVQRAERSSWRLTMLVRSLGEARYEPAIPTLAQLWRDCPFNPIRVAVAHALFAMQTDEARRALEAMVYETDDFSRHFAIQAVFERDPQNAYDLFEPMFYDLSRAMVPMALSVLAVLAPSSYRHEGGQEQPSWTDPCAPEWLRQEPRWLDLCARLRRGERFGGTARDVLRHADPELRDAALNRVRREEQGRTTKARAKRIGNLVDRYRSGEFEPVWREIRAQGRVEGDFREEVQEVAKETMNRVARNANLICDRLEAEGWASLFGELRTLPRASDTEVFQRIEAITGGPVPPSLHAFWTVVGGIDWVWDYNSKSSMPHLGVDLPMDEMDPLCVNPAGVVTYLFEEWIEQKDECDPDLVDPYSLDLAPDVYHKANMSGGPTYAVELPFFGGDPTFANEKHELPFIDYLRLCFKWAGFPGLGEYGDRDDVRAFVENFGKDLEPF